MLRDARLLAYALELRLRLPRWFHAVPLDALLRATAHPMGHASVGDVLRITQRTERIAAWLRLSDTCLYRALTRRAALRAMGHPAVFVMGLEPMSGSPCGHAWVELDGEVVEETLEHDFQITFHEPPG